MIMIIHDALDLATSPQMSALVGSQVTITHDALDLNVHRHLPPCLANTGDLFKLEDTPTSTDIWWLLEFFVVSVEISL